MKPIDYLIKNELAIDKSKPYISLLPSKDIPKNSFCINKEELLDEHECKIYLCTLICYLEKYSSLDYFKLYLEEVEENCWNIYSTIDDPENKLDSKARDSLELFNNILDDILIILLPKMPLSNISWLSESLLYDCD